jgi:hypothetical protein
VAALVARLLHTRDRAELETLADELATTGATQAVHPLVLRLTESIVQDDPDVETAVCEALVTLGVMTSSGNLSYAFRPDAELDADARRAVTALRATLPARYLVGR